MGSGPSFLPEEIAAIHAACPKCGAVVRPNLWNECDFPFTPIYPEGTKGEKGAWIRISSVSKCTCGEEIEFPIEAKKLEHPLFFYGDDADRLLGGYSLHSYSLIGGTSGPIKEMCEELAKLKREYVPSLAPDKWRIHVTEMLNSRKRITHAIYKHFNRDSLNQFFLDCADILRSQDKMTWNQHVTAVVKTPKSKKERKKHLNEARHIAHNALLSYAIHKATKQNLRPLFTFDACKPIKRYPHIEGWSFSTYSNSRRYLAHAYLTHSNDIAPPSFAEPGSHPCLELADIHAYFAARSMYERYQGKEPQLPLDRFGVFRYINVNHGERFEFYTGADIPRGYHPIKNSHAY
ncbi:hypothetical protein [Spongiibacter sp.]|uniref:hypothetical protein n=1 Tax=Spongiibacter sp. TaxID=2024860 RepID=UPI00257EE410|nr:hypothetical protein [Spongiibacter sp.]